jgi:hypothetical protein
MMGITIWLATIAYGAVHTAAWHDFFPSAFEQWMWRASALYIMWSGLVWLSINVLAQVFPAVDRYWVKALNGHLHWWHYVVLLGLCTICGTCYIAARLYLVVEAFVSLRQLPASAYLTPDWSLLIPHL